MAERRSAAGRKSWDEVAIFKALVVQALYNLCDEQTEYQLCDQPSFMRFLVRYDAGYFREEPGAAKPPTWICERRAKCSSYSITTGGQRLTSILDQVRADTPIVCFEPPNLHPNGQKIRSTWACKASLLDLSSFIEKSRPR